VALVLGSMWRLSTLSQIAICAGGYEIVVNVFAA
jgi:hypothetical protein